MPSERSIVSEITGLNAARQNARSISLHTCCRPFWITARVTGSIVLAVASITAPPRRSHRHDQVAEPVALHGAARLDERGAVELLDHRRPVEACPRGQALAPVDRRVDPALLEPDPAPLDLGL